MTIIDLVEYGRKTDASDIHLTAGLLPVFRRQGMLVQTEGTPDPDAIERLIRSMLNSEQLAHVEAGEDVDFGFELPNGSRQRVNVYHQKGRLCAAIRLLNSYIPTIDGLQLPDTLKALADEPRGLVLVVGPTGSGKSTTLAAMIDYINERRRSHILTIEDPIEYVHTHKKSMINQREVGRDVSSFSGSLRSALREDPDVILVGEMRDFETIGAALTAAETGHLVFSTLHTIGAALTIDRIIDVFPAHQQQQVRTQLAGVLKGVITQSLLPRANGKGRIAAFELMVSNEAVSNMIRENKCHQLNSVMQTSKSSGMRTLNADLADLVKRGEITMADAEEKASDRRELKQYLSR